MSRTVHPARLLAKPEPTLEELRSMVVILKAELDAMRMERNEALRRLQVMIEHVYAELEK